ncbi:MAG TPA: hypothetical protein VIR33_11850 [Thermopolyspora sp.]
MIEPMGLDAHVPGFVTGLVIADVAFVSFAGRVGVAVPGVLAMACGVNP